MNEECSECYHVAVCEHGDGACAYFVSAAKVARLFKEDEDKMDHEDHVRRLGEYIKFEHDYEATSAGQDE